MLIFFIMNNEEKNYLKQRAKEIAEASLIPLNRLTKVEDLTQEMYEILQIQRYVREESQPAIPIYLYACHGFMIFDSPKHSMSQLNQACKKLKTISKLDTISGKEKEVSIDVMNIEGKGVIITWRDQNE